MATLADELLNDFEDSESEGDGEQQTRFLQDEASPPQIHGATQPHNGSMQLNRDEEDDGAHEEIASSSVSKDGVDDVADEEEAKAKVEKMQLGGVNDVRNVASLMKTLEPVLQVRIPFLKILCLLSNRYLNLHLAWTQP